MYECEQKLERAQKLIGGLSDEKTRWKESSEELDAKLGNLVGDVLISSAVIAFLGAFTASYLMHNLLQLLSIYFTFEYFFKFIYKKNNKKLVSF